MVASTLDFLLVRVDSVHFPSLLSERMEIQAGPTTIAANPTLSDRFRVARGGRTRMRFSLYRRPIVVISGASLLYRRDGNKQLKHTWWVVPY